MVKVFQKGTLPLGGVIALLISTASPVYSRPSISEIDVSSQLRNEAYLESDSDFYLVRGRRALPGWIARIPKRGIQRWLNSRRGIYLTRQGSVIGPYHHLKQTLAGGKRPNWLPKNLRNARHLHAHHIVETRVARAFGFDPKDLPAVVLRRRDHVGRNGIHSLLIQLLPQGNRWSGARSYQGKLAQINQAYQRAYRNRPDWLTAITALMNDWSSNQR